MVSLVGRTTRSRHALGRMIRSRRTQRASYMVPRSLYRSVARAHLGYDLGFNDFFWRARHLRSILSLPPRRLSMKLATGAAQKLRDSSRHDDHIQVADAILDALRSGDHAEASSMAEHGIRLMDTRSVRLVSHKHRFVWFSVEKVASSSIGGTLMMLDPSAEMVLHRSLPEFCDRYSMEIENYFTFGFMRYPVGRLRSLVEHVYKKPNRRHRRALACGPVPRTAG